MFGLVKRGLITNKLHLASDLKINSISKFNSIQKLKFLDFVSR